MTLYTVNDVADNFLKLSRSKVYALVEQAKLGHHRFDGAIRISDEQIAQYLEETKRGRAEQVQESQPAKSRLRRLRL
jgi:excisionase family DNA binding protein